MAYHAQSIISLNQLGLAVWGWIISGALIGYEINTRNVDAIQANNSSKKKQRTASQIVASKVQPKTLLAMFGLLIVGVLVGLPPLVASTNYWAALNSRDPKRVEQAAKIWPVDPRRIEQVAVLLANQGLQVEALSVLEDGKVRFPDEFHFWRLISEIPNATPDKKLRLKPR